MNRILDAGCGAIAQVYDEQWYGGQRCDEQRCGNQTVAESGSKDRKGVVVTKVNR